MDKLPNIHPGEILREEFLAPLELTPREMARALHAPTNLVRAVLDEKEPVSADLALRLARYFGTTERFWLGLQSDYDLEEARNRLGDRIEREIVPRSAA